MRGPSLNFPDRFNAAADLLDRNLEEGRGGKVAIRTAAGDHTYQQIATAANRAGNALLDLGLEIENRLLMAVLDTPEFVATFFGAIKCGVVPVPVNPQLKAHDFAYLLNDSRAKAAVVSEAVAPLIREIRPQLKYLKHLVVIGRAEPGELSYAELVEAASDQLRPADTGKDDMCFWLYSSGTTGFPKGAVHLQHDMRVSAELYAKPILGLGEQDVTLSVAKLYFAYGLGNGAYFALAGGGTTVLHPGPPAPAAMIDLVRRFRPTLFFAAPTWYANTLAAGSELWQSADFSSVRHCVSAGEPLSGSLLERWKLRTGTVILDGIGSTEICHIFISNRPDDVRPDSTGRIVPGYEARIVDEEGADLPDGEIGSLLVKGDSTCAYYWNQHERTKRTFLGEWINTGDKYLRDPEGYLTYQGRGDDMMKVSGIWVSPTEVESAINSHPAVIECAVVATVDENRLLHPQAYVVLRPDFPAGPPIEDQLREHVRVKLAHYKCPRDFHFVSELPKTATGKIQRYRLREETAGGPA